jgi:hypothetical protein
MRVTIIFLIIAVVAIILINRGCDKRAVKKLEKNNPELLAVKLSIEKNIQYATLKG